MMESVQVRLEKLISQCVDALKNDSPELAAQGLEELAYLCGTHGYTMEFFMDTRKRIIILAELESSVCFIQEKLKIAEEQLRSNRNARNTKH